MSNQRALTEAQAASIRLRYLHGGTQAGTSNQRNTVRSLALEFCVGRQTIHRVLKRKAS